MLVCSVQDVSSRKYKAFHPWKSIVLPVLRFIQYVRTTIPQYLDSISELVGSGVGGEGGSVSSEPAATV
jgi:hypothetical protein